jgi:hypothetical protein
MGPNSHPPAEKPLGRNTERCGTGVCAESIDAASSTRTHRSNSLRSHIGEESAAVLTPALAEVAA